MGVELSGGLSLVAGHYASRVRPHHSQSTRHDRPHRCMLSQSPLVARDRCDPLIVATTSVKFDDAKKMKLVGLLRRHRAPGAQLRRLDLRRALSVRRPTCPLHFISQSRIFHICSHSRHIHDLFPFHVSIISCFGTRHDRRRLGDHPSYLCEHSHIQPVQSRFETPDSKHNKPQSVSTNPQSSVESTYTHSVRGSLDFHPRCSKVPTTF